MKHPHAATIAKVVLAVATLVGSAAGGSHLAHQEHGVELTQLIAKIDALQSDVRLLKCAAKFPGDCPGQAK